MYVLQKKAKTIPVEKRSSPIINFFTLYSRKSEIKNINDASTNNIAMFSSIFIVFIFIIHSPFVIYVKFYYSSYINVVKFAFFLKKYHYIYMSYHFFDIFVQKYKKK